MPVHHLSCGEGYPLSSRVLPHLPSHFVCHCLLVESARGLILVDTGMSRADAAYPRRRLGPMRHLLGLRLSELRPAIEQIEARGLDPRQVTDIVLTHLDLDHAGGLVDFPEACVHVSDVELRAATRPATWAERWRYRPAQWEHGPQWKPHEPANTEPWFGLDAVRLPLPDLEMVLVSLPGHTRGHCGVALRQEGGWLLHVGDTYYARVEMERKPGLATRFFHRSVMVNPVRARESLDQLRRLATTPGITLISSHDPTEFARHATEPGPRESDRKNDREG